MARPPAWPRTTWPPARPSASHRWNSTNDNSNDNYNNKDNSNSNNNDSTNNDSSSSSSSINNNIPPMEKEPATPTPQI